MNTPLHYLAKLRPSLTREQARVPRVSEPTIFVIFGVTGNLAQHRLLPALYHLIKDDLLHENTAIVGISRKDITADELLNKTELCVLETDKTCDPAVLKKFRARFSMVKLDPVHGADYDTLRHTLQAIEDANGMCMNRLFYLSIPPQVYAPVIGHLGEHGLNVGCKHSKGVSRLLVEKPFGYDLISARELIDGTARYFSDTQVFRIDHYLAKETAQNMLVFRERNPAFSSIWNHHHVSAIDLVFSEQIGVEGRNEFYDSVGALRDVVQNHLMQLLALATMELPKTMTSASLHASKQVLLAAIPPINPGRQPVIRGQYAGYQEEVHNPGSTTETYVQLRLTINNSRWRGTPITMTAGKALVAKQTTVAVTFADPRDPLCANRLTFRILPNEGIDISLCVKRPGYDDETETVSMNFVYDNAAHPDAYERVIIDAAKGDQSLFATRGEVLESWRILQPILDTWGQRSDMPLAYQPGTNGPVTTISE